MNWWSLVLNIFIGAVFYGFILLICGANLGTYIFIGFCLTCNFAQLTLTILNDIAERMTNRTATKPQPPQPAKEENLGEDFIAYKVGEWITK